MPGRRRAKIYWRNQGGARRAWGDFREYARWGGKRCPLIWPGETNATTDEVRAHELFARRLQELRDARDADTCVERPTTRPPLHQAIADYLSAKVEEPVTAGWVAAHAGFLAKAIAFFGAGIKLNAITPERVTEFIAWLRRQPTPQGGTYSEQSLRHHLYALSALYRKAQRKGWAARGVNPVGLLERHERPRVGRSKTDFLEVPDAARLLWAAATYPTKRNEPEMAVAYALIGTFLLTGGREKEVLGLAIPDIRLDRDTVAFRPHPWHEGGRLKTEGAERTISLWPQLREILEAYLASYRRRLPGLALFPSPHVQLDQGRPVSLYTGAQELGHESEEMVRRVYARLGTIRHRADARNSGRSSGSR